jgi:hypothetical protein
MEAMVQIFLSYARKDKTKVENLYQKLSDEGFKPWMDKKDIIPGEHWEPSIRQAIQNSHFVLACLSTNSIDKRGMLQKEIKMALDMMQEMLESDIYLIPVRLEKCEVPQSLRLIQYVDLFEQNGWIGLKKSIQEGIKRRREDKPNIQEPPQSELYPSHEGPSSDKDVPTQAKGLKAMTKVVLMIDMDLEHFTETDERLLQFGLAKFLNISTSNIKITSLKKGSVKVTVELPTQSAEQLLSAYKRNDPELVKHLPSFVLLDLSIEAAEHEAITAEHEVKERELIHFRRPQKKNTIMKPFIYWARLVTAIWLSGFFLVTGSVVGVLGLAKIGGLKSAMVLQIILQLLEIYLPYLGIIFGAFAFAWKEQRWDDHPVESIFPLLLLVVSIFFNLLLAIWTGSFLIDKYANYEDYLSDIKTFSAAMAFFICWFLTYFFESGSRKHE